ncbi:hypothetical protein GCM10027035_05270 [Emticicia sediminis]
MRNFILYIFLFISTNQAFGQLKKGSWLFGSSINYNTRRQEGNTDNGQPYLGGNVNNYSVLFNGGQQINNSITAEYYIDNKSVSTSLSPTISYFLSNHIFIGIGITHQRENVKNINRTMRNDISTNQTFVFETTNQTTEKVNEKFAMIGYWKTLTPKIFFSTLLHISSLRSSTNNSTITLSSFLPYTKPDNLSERELGFQNKYYALRLEPTLGYLISNTIGLNITFGGLSYENNLAPKGSIKDENVNFSINPKNWKFGLFYYLSKK